MKFLLSITKLSTDLVGYICMDVSQYIITGKGIAELVFLTSLSRDDRFGTSLCVAPDYLSSQLAKYLTTGIIGW